MSPVKQCRKCNEWLPTEAFRRNPKLKSGLHSWCKPCCVARTRQWRAENPDYVEAYNHSRRKAASRAFAVRR